MRLKLLTAPITLPISNTEAKAQCRVTTAADDALFDAYISSAALHIQNITGRSLMQQTWQVFLDGFQDSMLLPRGPVRSVSSVKYYDPSGAIQTLASTNYAVDNVDEEGPAWVVRASDAVWPVVATGINNVIIEYVCGYVTVPDSIKHAIKYLVGHFYDNRVPIISSRSALASVQLEHTLDALLANHRSYW